LTSGIRLFTRVTVAKPKSVVANPDEPADPEEGGGFAEWAMLTPQVLRIELAKSYRVAVDLLSEMPGVLDEIGLTRFPHYTVLRTWFERIRPRHGVRFSARRPRNALVTLRLTQLALTVTNQADTTLTAQATVSGR
jgi:hypothetical protein